MGNRRRLLFIYVLSIIILQSSINQLFGQEKVNITAGAGFLEALNLGVRFQHKQTQFGFSLGTFPIEDESFFSVSSDFFYHFGGLSDLSERRPWYSRAGLNYSRDEKSAFVDKLLYLNLRFGRDLNISRRIGIAIDAGIGIRILSDIESGWDFPVMPNFGLVLFYRL